MYLRASWRLALALPAHPRPGVITRAQWNAAHPRRRYGSRGRLEVVVVHHTRRRNARLSSGDVADEAAFMREIQQSHLDRGFMDIGYHFMVMPSGRVFLGRPLSAFGAHVQRHNVGAVGVAVAGNFDDAPPTDEALASLERVIGRVLRWRHVPVVGHADLADEHTTCPGHFLRLHFPARPEPDPQTAEPDSRAASG